MILKEGYLSWNKFKENKIPSSLSLFDDIYDYLELSDKIIDIGCGFGKTCFHLLKKGYDNITGVDINSSGIKFAQEMFESLSKSRKRLSFRVENALHLSFPDSSFDFAIAQALLTAIPQKKDRIRILKEINRILSDSGYFYAAVFCQTWHIPKYRNRYLKAMAEGCEKGNFPVLNAQTQELDYIAHHYSEEELVKLLLKSGFNIKKFCYRTFTTRSGSKINGMVVIAEKKS